MMDVAWQSIRHGLARGRPAPVDVHRFDPALRERRATFVTLRRGEELRGCIGVLEHVRPLVEDVAHNAFAAAMRDPRFEPVSPLELGRLTVHISVLGEPEPMQFTDEADLLAQLRPHVDGLILSSRGRKSTFLPAVWESLPDPRQFLAHLKVKAGLPQDYWSDDLEVRRYTTESVE